MGTLEVDKSLKAAFKEMLEPHGFKKVKGRYPHFVRMATPEIIQVINYRLEQALSPQLEEKRFEVYCAVGSIYRPEINLNRSVYASMDWINTTHLDMYVKAKYNGIPVYENEQPGVDYIIKKGDEASLREQIAFAMTGIEHYIIPAFDKVVDLKAYRTNWNNLTMILDGSGEAGLSDSGADKLIIENFFVSDANRQYKVICDGSVFGITDFGSPCRTLYGTAGSDYMLGFDGGRMTYYGLDGADTLNGSDGTDVLYGGTGDDRILGGNGNDCLLGEAGNDYLEGGAGNDTYYFGIGYGTDSISDNSGINEIIFCEGLKCEDILVERTNWNDLTIRFAGSEDALVLLGYFTSDENKKFNLVFSDGVKYEYDAQENPILQELSMGE